MGGVSAPANRLAPWRVGLWLVLLLAAFGAMQYAVHAQRVWGGLAQPALPDEARASLRGMLAWDLGYFLAAALLVVSCAAGILRQGWSRPLLRFALGLLALGILASGAALLHRWRDWIASMQGAPDAMAAVAGPARAVHLSLGFDAAAIVLLGWLVWQLGRPAVRAQFRRRRP